MNRYIIFSALGFSLLWSATKFFPLGVISFMLCFVYQLIMFNKNKNIVFRLCMLSTWTGLVCNLLCLAANHGLMPVVTKDASIVYGVHKIAESGDHFLFLADWINLPIGIFSIGDFFIITPFLAVLLYVGYRWAVGRDLTFN